MNLQWSCGNSTPEKSEEKRGSPQAWQLLAYQTEVWEEVREDVVFTLLLRTWEGSFPSTWSVEPTYLQGSP